MRAQTHTQTSQWRLLARAHYTDNHNTEENTAGIADKAKQDWIVVAHEMWQNENPNL